MFTNLTNFRQLFSSLTGFVNPGDNAPLANNPQGGSAFFANFQAFLAAPDIAEPIAVDTQPVGTVLPKVIGSASDFLTTFFGENNLAIGQGGQHGDLPAGDAKRLLASPEIRLPNDKTATIPNRLNYSKAAPGSARPLQIDVAESIIGSARPGKTRKLSSKEDVLPSQNIGLPPAGLLALSPADTGGPAILASSLPGQLPLDPAKIANGETELPVQTVSPNVAIGETSTPLQPASPNIANDKTGLPLPAVSSNIVNGETSTPLQSISPNIQNGVTTVAPSDITKSQPSLANVTPGTLLQNASVRHAGQGAKKTALTSPQLNSVPLNHLTGVGAENQTGVTGQTTQADAAALLPGVELQSGVVSPAQSSRVSDASPLPANHILNDESVIQIRQDIAGKNGTAPSGSRAPLIENNTQKGISFTSALFEPAPVEPEILAFASNIRRPVPVNSGQVAGEIPAAPIIGRHVKHASRLTDLTGLPGRVTPAVHNVLNGIAPQPQITPSFTRAPQPKTRSAGNGVQTGNPNSAPDLKQDVNLLSNAAVSPKMGNIAEMQIAAPPVATQLSRGDALYATNLRGLKDVRVTPEIVEIPQKISENSAPRISRPVEQNTLNHHAVKASAHKIDAGSALPSRNVETEILPQFRPQTGVVRESGRATVPSSQRRFFQNNQHVDGKAPAPIQTGLAESILPQSDILKPAQTGERVTAYRPVKNATPVNNQKTGQVIVNDANGSPQPTKIEFSTQPFEYIAARDDSHSDSVSEPALRKQGDSAAPRSTIHAPADKTAAVIANDLPKSAPVSVLNKNGVERSPENVVRRNGFDVAHESPRVSRENIVENVPRKFPGQPENIFRETQNKVVGNRNQRPDVMDNVAGRLFREPEISSSLENMIPRNENENGVIKRPFFSDRQTVLSAKNSIPRGASIDSHMQKPVLTPENNFPVSRGIAEDVLLPERSLTELESVDHSDALTRDVEKRTPEKLSQPRPVVSQTHQRSTPVNFPQSAGSQSVPVTAHENRTPASPGLLPLLAENIAAPVTVAEVPVFEIKKYDHNSTLAARQAVDNLEVIPNNIQSQMPNMLLQAAVNEAAPARPGFRPRPAREARHGVRPNPEVSGETTLPDVQKTPVIDLGRDLRVAPTLHAAKNLQIDTAGQDSGLQNHTSLFTGAQTDVAPGENITGSSIHSFVQTGAKTPTITFQNSAQFTTQLASMVQEQAYDIFRQPGAMPQQLFIQLEPKEMGIIRLRLSMKKNKLVGKIETGVAETSSLLHQNHSQLLSKLGDMGVQVHDFTISHNENLAGNQQQFAREQSAHQQAGSGQYVEEGDVETPTGTVRNQVVQTDRIDVTV